MSEEPTLEQILDDPRVYGYTYQDAEKMRGDLVLGQAATMLFQRGQNSSAALVRDVEALFFESRSSAWGSSFGWRAVLDVEPFMRERFTEERIAEITAVIHEIKDRDKIDVDEIKLRDALPKVGLNWREEFDKLVSGETVTNQGQAVRLESRIREDGLYLTNVEEQKVYLVLRGIQESMPSNDAIGIAPLAGMRTPGHTYWPDFLVTYRGRVGIIEVDSFYHRGRRDADASRERLLIQAGVHRVDRIAVEDLKERASVERWVQDFLKLLSER